MSFALIQKVNNEQKKAAVVDARSGDTVRVHQKIKEGTKERIQIFEGVVIRTDHKDSLTSRITVRKIASGVGVEKSLGNAKKWLQKAAAQGHQASIRVLETEMTTRFSHL